MLNGIAPLLIFSFPPSVPNEVFNAVNGLPIIGNNPLFQLGIPIPIYLDENLTGIYVESQSKSIDIDTDITPLYRSTTNTTTSFINQSGINNLVSVQLLASRSSVLLSVILAMCDMAFDKIVQSKYTVSYINGSTLIFGGLLHSFSSQQSSTDDLVHINLQIQRNNQNKPTAVNSFYPSPSAGTGLVPKK